MSIQKRRTGYRHFFDQISSILHYIYVVEEWYIVHKHIVLVNDMWLIRVVVSVSTSRSRDVSTLVSVSAIDVSCPRPIFRQIVQVTIIKLIKSVVAVNESLAELV